MPSAAVIEVRLHYMHINSYDLKTQPLHGMSVHLVIMAQYCESQLGVSLSSYRTTNLALGRPCAQSSYYDRAAYPCRNAVNLVFVLTGTMIYIFIYVHIFCHVSSCQNVCADIRRLCLCHLVLRFRRVECLCEFGHVSLLVSKTYTVYVYRWMAVPEPCSLRTAVCTALLPAKPTGGTWSILGPTTTLKSK